MAQRADLLVCSEALRYETAVMKQRFLLILAILGVAGGICVGCTAKPQTDPDPTGAMAATGSTEQGNTTGPRQVPRARPVQKPPPRRVVTPPASPASPVKTSPKSGGGLLLGPAPKSADLTDQARYLYGRIVCQGRTPDGPCKSLDQAVTIYRSNYLAPMRPWLASRRPKQLPPALLYPFSGGDLISALSVYPHQRQFLHFSLEHGGPASAIRGMSPALELQARWKLVWMVRNLLMAGESFSVDLQKQEQAGLPGTLPLLLVALKVHGGTITGLSYVKVKPDGSLERYSRKELASAGARAKRRDRKWKDPRFSHRYSNVELRFRLKGDTQDRSIIHVAANLSNGGLAKRPGLLALIKRLGPHALMIKAASYLMWDNGFSTIRAAVFSRAAWAISDVSAPYPTWLIKNGWQLEAYGRFDCLKKKKMHASSIGWRMLFRRPKSRALPFRYGYVDCKSQHHVVLLSRRTGSP